MKDLTFRDRLVDTAFVSNNYIIYSGFTNLPLYNNQKSGEPIPYYYQNTGGILKAYNTRQFRGRGITRLRFEELLNIPLYPIFITYVTRTFFIAKGFLFDINRQQVLFLATVPYMGGINSMEQVTFYVSKTLKEEEYKRIKLSIDHIIKDHPGDIIYTDNIEKKIFSEIEIPVTRTIAEHRTFTNALVGLAIENFLEQNIPQVSPITEPDSIPPSDPTYSWNIPTTGHAPLIITDAGMDLVSSAGPVTVYNVNATYEISDQANEELSNEFVVREGHDERRRYLEEMLNTGTSALGDDLDTINQIFSSGDPESEPSVGITQIMWDRTPVDPSRDLQLADIPPLMSPESNREALRRRAQEIMNNMIAIPASSNSVGIVEEISAEDTPEEDSDEDYFEEDDDEDDDIIF